MEIYKVTSFDEDGEVHEETHVAASGMVAAIREIAEHLQFWVGHQFLVENEEVARLYRVTDELKIQVA